MIVAVVGATGLVGREMLTVLAERGFGQEEIIPAASPKSVGKTIDFAGRTLTVVSVDDAIAARPDYAIFSAGAAASRQYAPRFVEVGTNLFSIICKILFGLLNFLFCFLNHSICKRTAGKAYRNKCCSGD